MQNGLTSIDIVRIIRACGDSGVKSLKYKDLELSLEEQPETLPAFTQDMVYVNRQDSHIPVATDDELYDNEIKEPIDESEIEELKITNPAAYEDIMEKAYA